MERRQRPAVWTYRGCWHRLTPAFLLIASALHADKGSARVRASGAATPVRAWVVLLSYINARACARRRVCVEAVWLALSGYLLGF